MPASALKRRLDSFLNEARPLIEQRRQAPPRDITATKVEQILGYIRPKLHAAQAEGAFMNIWSEAGLKRNELRNAAVLAWLLNPQGTHGLGHRMTKALFSRVHHSPAWLRQRTDFGGVTVVTEERPLGSADNRVDISITGPDFIVFIEVKIDALESDHQLDRYLSEMELKSASHGNVKSALVFLTRHGDARNANCASLGWRDVEQALTEIARGLPPTDIRKSLLIQFAGHIHSF